MCPCGKETCECGEDFSQYLYNFIKSKEEEQADKVMNENMYIHISREKEEPI